MATKEKSVAVSLTELTEKNVRLLRIVNTTCLPVAYPDTFYKNVLARPELCKFVYLGDVPAGAIACRLERIDEASNRLYIMTLGVLPPYTRRGLGSRLLEHVLTLATSNSGKHNVTEIALDVQQGNEAALAFYKKHGFEVKGERKAYYQNVTPADAWHLQRAVAHK